MAKSTQTPPTPGGAQRRAAISAREQRLAAALRTNLRRRKALAPSAPAPPTPDADEAGK